MATQKKEKIHFRATPSFKARVYKLAQRKDMPISELVRYLLRRELERENIENVDMRTKEDNYGY